MWNKIVIICAIIKLSLQSVSLIDYKTCQNRLNCTETLKPSDCLSIGSYLDVFMGNDQCCHGCRRGGVGNQKHLFAAVNILFYAHFSRSERGESGCSRSNVKKLCAPGLKCDEDFYCILNRSKKTFLKKKITKSKNELPNAYAYIFLNTYI